MHGKRPEGCRAPERGAGAEPPAPLSMRPRRARCDGAYLTPAPRCSRTERTPRRMAGGEENTNNHETGSAETPTRSNDARPNARRHGRNTTTPPRRGRGVLNMHPCIPQPPLGGARKRQKCNTARAPLPGEAHHQSRARVVDPASPRARTRRGGDGEMLAAPAAQRHDSRSSEASHRRSCWLSSRRLRRRGARSAREVTDVGAARVRAQRGESFLSAIAWRYSRRVLPGIR